jgi:UDP-N-acetylmuramyl pentapeptide phosphotransferase/UDP-N-acetylglucosamine-1-phosphate transferase
VTTVGRTVAAVGLAVAGTAATWAIAHRLPAVRERLSRTNFRDEPVTLIEGPALVVGLTTAAYVDPAVAFAAAGAGVFGLIDDVAGSADRRGLKGHLSGLAHGEVTTGALKIVGIGATGVVAAALLDRGRWRLVGTPTAAVLIAASANLMNLFDLRPGRALKVGALADLPLLLRRPEVAVVPLAAGAVLLPADLAGRSMMGDTGANALGAAIAAGWARTASTPARIAATTAVVALMVASEKVSFSQVIDGQPVLRAIDRWGRPQ